MDKNTDRSGKINLLVIGNSVTAQVLKENKKKAILKKIALNRVLCPGLESNQHILANGRF